MAYNPPVTNFKDSNNIDLGRKLVTRDYLLNVYPSLVGNSTGSGLSLTPALWTWGFNSYGQLGINNTSQRNTPVTTFAGGFNWKSISNGSTHAAAIKNDGTLWLWGENTYGQLGTNDATQRNTPVTTFAGGNNWESVSCGSYHTAAIKTDGTLWTWGYGFNGELGNNVIATRRTPVTTVAGGTNWKQVSCGDFHNVAIKTDGTLWTWGQNITGELGVNDTTQRNTPVTTFAGGTNWKKLGPLSTTSAAIKTDGTLWVWGTTTNGALGTNDSTQKNTPVTTFSGGTNWYSFDGGYFGMSAIKTDGTLWTWGYNANGQLGNNNTTYYSVPVTTFAGGNNWKQVSRGLDHVAAIKTDGTLWVWGAAINGALGTNDTTDRLTPVTTFAGGTNWKQVSCGSGSFTVAIRTVDLI